MKKNILNVVLIILFNLPVFLFAEDDSVSYDVNSSPFMSSVQNMSSWFYDLLKDRVEIGTRVVYYELKTPEDDFIGSIDTLEEKQNYDPTRVFLDISLFTLNNLNFNCELTWERLALNTISSENGQNDGTLDLSGPLFTLNTRYLNNSRFIPYGGVGMVWFNRTHVTKGWWHYGFNYDEDWHTADAEYYNWKQNGESSWPNGGFTRTFELDETMGWVVNFGCSINLFKNLDADVYWSYTDAVTDLTYDLSFYGNPVDTRYDEFDVSNYTYGVGLRYKFR